MKRFLSLILVFALLLSAMPVVAFAEEQEDDGIWYVKSAINEADLETVQWMDVVVYTKSTLGFRDSWIVITVSNQNELYYYRSATKSTFIRQPLIREIAAADENLENLYPHIEKFLLDSYAKAYYEEKIKDYSDSEIPLAIMQELFEEWLVEAISDIATEAYLSGLGTLFSFNDVADTLYSESLDFNDTMQDVVDTLSQENDFWTSLIRLIVILNTIDKYRPTADDIVNLVLKKEKIIPPDMQSEVEMQNAGWDFMMDYGQLIASR